MTIELRVGLEIQNEVDVSPIASLEDYNKLPANRNSQINLNNINGLNSQDLKNIMIPLVFKENKVTVWVRLENLERIIDELPYFNDVAEILKYIVANEENSYEELFRLNHEISYSFSKDLEIIANIQSFLAQLTCGLVYAYKAMHTQNEIENYLRHAEKHLKAAINMSKKDNDDAISKNIISYLKRLTKQYEPDPAKVIYLKKIVNNFDSQKKPFFIRFFKPALDSISNSFRSLVSYLSHMFRRAAPRAAKQNIRQGSYVKYQEAKTSSNTDNFEPINYKKTRSSFTFKHAKQWTGSLFKFKSARPVIVKDEGIHGMALEEDHQNFEIPPIEKAFLDKLDLSFSANIEKYFRELHDYVELEEETANAVEREGMLRKIYDDWDNIIMLPLAAITIGDTSLNTFIKNLSEYLNANDLSNSHHQEPKRNPLRMIWKNNMAHLDKAQEAMLQMRMSIRKYKHTHSQAL